MGKISLRETIHQILEDHLNNNNGILLGECVSDPGGVAGTIPESSNVVDLPMTEVAGADFAVGCALVGRRPVFVVRFQDFMLMNGSPFIAYAATVYDIHGMNAPVFIRALANDRFDATHSNVLHSMFMHNPGFRVCAPMTPGEYREAWDVFMQHDSPMYVSEFRDAYPETEEMPDEVVENAQINLFAVSKCRQNMLVAKRMLAEEGIAANCFHIMWLKPFNTAPYIPYLQKQPLGLVVDPGRVNCGASESIAYQLMMACPGSHVEALGCADTIKTTNPLCYNEAPTAEQIAYNVRKMLKR